MGNACSCPPGKQDDASTTLDVGFSTVKALQAPPDIIESAAKLVEESPTTIANADDDRAVKDANVTEPAAEPAAVLVAAPAEEEAAAPSSKEEFNQDRLYREVVLNSEWKQEEVKPSSIARRPSSENISLQDYTNKHAALFDKVLALEQPEGWVLKKEVDSVQIYTKEMPGEKLLYFKGTTEMKVAGGIPEILAKLFKTEDRPRWDDLCSHAETPQSVPPLYKYAYVQLNAPVSIISKRDILTLGRFRFEKDGAVVAALHSEELDSYPERSDYVRINFIEGGYVIRPKNGAGDHFEITWTGLVDPQGWLPTWVSNHAVLKQGVSLAKLRAFVLSKGPSK